MIPITHVRQQDPCGCLAACCAMVAGQTYTAAREFFLKIGKRFDREGGGITEYDAEYFLGEHGFAFIRKYRWYGANLQRETWPVEPFAPVHIVGVRGAGHHGVVLLDDGTILDPFFDQPRQLSDYPDVAYMLGVWNVSEAL